MPKIKSLEKIYADTHYKTVDKLYSIAKDYGHSKQAVKDFVASLSKDQPYTRQTEMMMSIYSEVHDAYQMDTFENTNGDPPYFLIITNVNSRMTYSYPMETKDSIDVHNALASFQSNHRMNALTTDEDPAYQAKIVQKLLKDHEVDHHTTSRNDHSRLGIINRVIRTIRDHGPTDEDDESIPFTEKSMLKTVKMLNHTNHRTTGIAPEAFTKKDEDDWIARMRSYTDYIRNKYNLEDGTKVQLMIDRTTGKNSKFNKIRSNLSKQAYTIDSKDRNHYIVKARDGSAALYPRWRLVKARQTIPLAKTIDNGKHAVVEKIESYGHKHYNVLYDDGSRDTIGPKALREGRPLRLSLAESQFWKDHDGMPDSFKKMKGIH